MRGESISALGYFFFYGPTAGRNRGNATTGNKGGEDRNPAREAKSEGRCKTSRSFHLLRPYISPIPARPFFFFAYITYISSFESGTKAKSSEDCKSKKHVILLSCSSGAICIPLASDRHINTVHLRLRDRRELLRAFKRIYKRNLLICL